MVWEYAYGHIVADIRVDRFSSQQRLLIYMRRCIYKSWWENWYAAAFIILYVQVHICCMLLPLICLSAAAYRLEWRRRGVRCNLNVVCRAFRVGHFTAGLFSCLVCVNCIDTRVSFPSFGGFSLLFVGTRGSTGIRNSRGRIFELNSFHLGQDCPQSFLNLTPSIWVKCPHLSDVVLPSGASFGHVVLNLDPSIWVWGSSFRLEWLEFKECGLSLLSSHSIARTTRESTWYSHLSVGAIRAMLHLLNSRERNFSL